MLPLQPKDQVPELLGMADIHLLPQDPGVALRAGRPLGVAAGAAEVPETLAKVREGP